MQLSIPKLANTHGRLLFSGEKGGIDGGGDVHVCVCVCGQLRLGGEKGGKGNCDWVVKKQLPCTEVKRGKILL